MPDTGKSTIRRVWLLVRDIWQELPSIWWLARTRDCERNGGHRWGPVTETDLLGPARECGRCAVTETVARTHWSPVDTSQSNMTQTYMRQWLGPFTEDWDHPDMDAYDR